MTVITTKLWAWLHRNSLAKYISLAKHQRSLPTEWVLLTEKQCLGQGLRDDGFVLSTREKSFAKTFAKKKKKKEGPLSSFMRVSSSD